LLPATLDDGAGAGAGFTLTTVGLDRSVPFGGVGATPLNSLAPPFGLLEGLQGAFFRRLNSQANFPPFDLLMAATHWSEEPEAAMAPYYFPKETRRG